MTLIISLLFFSPSFLKKKNIVEKFLILENFYLRELLSERKKFKDHHRCFLAEIFHSISCLSRVSNALHRKIPIQNMLLVFSILQKANSFLNRKFKKLLYHSYCTPKPTIFIVAFSSGLLTRINQAKETSENEARHSNKGP